MELRARAMWCLQVSTSSAYRVYCATRCVHIAPTCQGGVRKQMSEKDACVRLCPTRKRAHVPRCAQEFKHARSAHLPATCGHDATHAQPSATATATTANNKHTHRGTFFVGKGTLSTSQAGRPGFYTPGRAAKLLTPQAGQPGPGLAQACSGT
eukprot:5402098-Alexandrium_andersonii.AAC.1